MATAFQATTTAQTAIAAASFPRQVFIANTGPNVLYFSTDATPAVSATNGFPVAATTGVAGPIILNAGEVLQLITVTAAQVSPADTRFEIVGMAG